MSDDAGEKHYRNAYVRLKAKYEELSGLTEALRIGNRKLVDEKHSMQTEMIELHARCVLTEQMRENVKQRQETIIRRMETGLLTIYDRTDDPEIRTLALSTVKEALDCSRRRGGFFVARKGGKRMTLEEARRHLQMWLDAEAAVASGQRYKIGEHEMTRANLGEIAQRISYWRREVLRLEEKANGGRGGIHMFRVVPRD